MEIYKSFRPGDIVQARVTSLGDSQSYFLTTAENELGVVFAMSESGTVSWSGLICNNIYYFHLTFSPTLIIDTVQYVYVYG